MSYQDHLLETALLCEVGPSSNVSRILTRHTPVPVPTHSFGEPGFGNRDRTGVNGIPDSLYRRMRTNAASSVKDRRYYLQLAGTDGKVRLERVDVAHETGFSLVNPLSVKKQIEGQIIWFYNESALQQARSELGLAG